MKNKGRSIRTTAIKINTMNTELTDYERAYLRMLLNNKIKDLQLMLENRHLVELQEYITNDISELIAIKEKLTLIYSN
jgi:hypothetical protein